MKCLYLFSEWSEHSREIYQNTAHDQLIILIRGLKTIGSQIYEIKIFNIFQRF